MGKIEGVAREVEAKSCRESALWNGEEQRGSEVDGAVDGNGVDLKRPDQSCIYGRGRARRLYLSVYINDNASKSDLGRH